LERNNLFNDQIMNTVNQLGLANVDVENAPDVDDLTSMQPVRILKEELPNG